LPATSVAVFFCTDDLPSLGPQRMSQLAETFRACSESVPQALKRELVWAA
jgi:hypothetical protein